MQISTGKNNDGKKHIEGTERNKQYQKTKKEQLDEHSTILSCDIVPLVFSSLFLLHSCFSLQVVPGSHHPGARRHGQVRSNAPTLFGLKNTHMFILRASPKHQLKEEKFAISDMSWQITQEKLIIISCFFLLVQSGSARFCWYDRIIVTKVTL